MRTIGDHDVVLGASGSGLLAARVLADAYKWVTVVDRDSPPAPRAAEMSTRYSGRPPEARITSVRGRIGLWSASTESREREMNWFWLNMPLTAGTA